MKNDKLNNFLDSVSEDFLSKKVNLSIGDDVHFKSILNNKHTIDSLNPNFYRIVKEKIDTNPSLRFRELKIFGKNVSEYNRESIESSFIQSMQLVLRDEYVERLSQRFIKFYSSGKKDKIYSYISAISDTFKKDYNCTLDSYSLNVANFKIAKQYLENNNHYEKKKSNDDYHYSSAGRGKAETERQLTSIFEILNINNKVNEKQMNEQIEQISEHLYNLAHSITSKKRFYK